VRGSVRVWIYSVEPILYFIFDVGDPPYRCVPSFLFLFLFRVVYLISCGGLKSAIRAFEIDSVWVSWFLISSLYIWGSSVYHFNQWCISKIVIKTKTPRNVKLVLLDFKKNCWDKPRTVLRRPSHEALHNISLEDTAKHSILFPPTHQANRRAWG